MKKVFISWSGLRSRKLASALRSWLPKVLQNLDPWLSSDDIDGGARWLSELNRELTESHFGLVCLTPENLSEPWILFEAGAISKSLGASLVCPILFGLDPTDLKGPLAQFQAIRFEESDLLKLLLTLNRTLAPSSLPEDRLRETFDVWWPNLREAVDGIPDSEAPLASPRTDRDLLEEVLKTVRRLDRSNPIMRGIPNAPINLTPTEQRVFDLRYGADGGKPMSGPEIAEELNLSEEDYRSIDRALLTKMGVFGR